MSGYITNGGLYCLSAKGGAIYKVIPTYFLKRQCGCDFFMFLLSEHHPDGKVQEDVTGGFVLLPDVVPNDSLNLKNELAQEGHSMTYCMITSNWEELLQTDMTTRCPTKAELLKPQVEGATYAL